MGIQGLHQVIKDLQKQGHLSEYKGKTCVIDIMTWLYKGAYSCAVELATGKPTLAFLSFPIRMLNYLKQLNIRAICIFDGRPLNAKEQTGKDRSSNKQKNRDIGKAFLAQGNKEEARKYFSRALILRSKLIDLLVDVLASLKVEYIVAPYEADAQMAYMVKEKIADFAITEDSDLIAYGCPLILTKLSWDGYFASLNYEGFQQSNDEPEDKHLKLIKKMSRDNFVYTCIMSGCDYLPNIQGIGTKVALRLFSKFDTFDEIMDHLNQDKKKQDKVPEDYTLKANQVKNIFYYQTVYDPRSKKLTQCEPMPNLDQEVFDTEQERLDFVGPHDISASKLQDFIKGKLNRKTLEKRENHLSVLDLASLKKDWKHHEISDKSFYIIDTSFFDKDAFSGDVYNDKEQPQTSSSKPTSQDPEVEVTDIIRNSKQSDDRQESRNSEGFLDLKRALKAQMDKTLAIQAKARQVTELDFGFCSSSDDDDNAQEQKDQVKKLSLNSKSTPESDAKESSTSAQKYKSKDWDELSALCNSLDAHIKQEKELKKIAKAATPESNSISNPFAKKQVNSQAKKSGVNNMFKKTNPEDMSKQFNCFNKTKLNEESAIEQHPKDVFFNKFNTKDQQKKSEPKTNNKKRSYNQISGKKDEQPDKAKPKKTRKLTTYLPKTQ